MAKKNKKIKGLNSTRRLKVKAFVPHGVSLQANILQQARDFHRAGQLQHAEKLYKQVLLLESANAEALHQLGILAHQTGRHEIAVEMLSKALIARPDYVDAYNNLGIILHDLDRIEEAVASFNRAIALKPDHAQLHYNLGNALKDQGKLDEAVATYLWALSLNSNYSQAYNNLGTVLKDQDRLDEAAECFRRAITLNPDYEDAHYNLGSVLKDQGKLDKAAASFRRAITLNPDYQDAHYNLGTILKNQGRLDEAAESFRKVIALKPDSATAHYNLGITLNIQGKPDAAAVSFRQALTLKPNYVEAHYNLGCALREFGRIDDAIASFRKALALKPDFAGAYAALASCVKHTEINDDVKVMLALYNKGEELPVSDRIDLGFALGKVFEDLKEYDRSFAFMHEANRLRRKSVNYSIQSDVDLFARIKKTFSPDFFASHHDLGHKDRTPIFVLGMPRSGTTLVEQILASHPLVFGAGELAALEDLVYEICGAGSASRFPECMHELGADAFAGIGSDYVAKLREYSSDAEYITDKMLYNFLYVGLIRTILPKAKVIHCQRNPMDTCFSIYKKDFAATHEFAYDMLELGQFYNLYIDLMAHWEKVLPGFMYTIRYEELVADQRNQTENLLDFCGLAWDDACLAFYKKERIITTASFAQVHQPMYKDSVELWKRYEKQLEPLRKTIYG